MDIADTAALKKNREQAEKGYFDAFRELGLGYARAKKPAEAAEYFKQGAALGDLNCQYFLVRDVLMGDSPLRDVANGMAMLGDAATKGHVDSMVEMGEELVKGRNIGRDLPRAFQLFTRYTETIIRLADIGSIGNLLLISARPSHLVICLAFGIGCKQDTVAAQQMLHRLAQRDFFGPRRMIEKGDIDVHLQHMVYGDLKPADFNGPVVIEGYDLSVMFGKIFRGWQDAGFFK